MVERFIDGKGEPFMQGYSMMPLDATDQQILDRCLQFPYQNLSGAVVIVRKGDCWTLHVAGKPAMQMRRMR